MGFRLKHDFEWTLSYLLFSIIRIVQFALAITVCALYGVDLNNAREQHKYMDGKWVFAEVIGGLSAFTALLYLIPFFIKIPFLFVWDAVLWLMWLVLFAIFGSLYIHEDPEGDGRIQRMKNAVWVDLANMLLWLITAVAMGGYWWKHKTTRSTFTGRAIV